MVHRPFRQMYPATGRPSLPANALFFDARVYVNVGDWGISGTVRLGTMDSGKGEGGGGAMTIPIRMMRL